MIAYAMRAAASSAGRYPKAAPSCALSEVESREFVMRLDLPGIDRGGDPTIGHNVGTPRQLERQRGLLLDQNHGQALVVEPAKGLQDLHRDLWCEPERWLV